MEDAEPVVEALDLVAWGVKGVSYTFVGNEHGAVVGEQSAARGQDVDRV
jgi:hypothetical protein